MPTDDTIVIRAPAGTKARWVRSAHPGKLSAWVCKMVDEPANPERYLARMQPSEPGSVTMLAEEELRDVIRRAYIAGARRE